MFAISWASGASVVTERRDSVFAALALAEKHAKDASTLRIRELSTGLSLTLEDLRSRSAAVLRPKRSVRRRKHLGDVYIPGQ
jgi:hypothetical protein